MQNGSCVCGQVAYEVTANPLRVIVCHCKFCQKLSGSAFAIEPIFNESDFTLLKGELTHYDHISEGSGKKVVVNFCGECGTKISLTPTRFADKLALYAGTFDEPNWFKMAPDNTVHVFTSEAMPGTILPPKMETFGRHFITNEGEAETAKIYQNPEIL